MWVNLIEYKVYKHELQKVLLELVKHLLYLAVLMGLIHPLRMAFNYHLVEK